jgi:hypothetical protein
MSTSTFLRHPTCFSVSIPTTFCISDFASVRSVRYVLLYKWYTCVRLSFHFSRSRSSPPPFQFKAMSQIVFPIGEARKRPTQQGMRGGLFFLPFLHPSFLPFILPPPSAFLPSFLPSPFPCFHPFSFLSCNAIIAVFHRFLSLFE